MKKHLLFKFLLTFTLSLFLSVGWVNAQTYLIQEDFSDLASSYTTGDVVLPSGTWNLTSVYGESSTNAYGGTGKAARVNDDTPGAQLTTPSMDNVGTIRLWYRELNSGGGTFSLQKSVGGGAFTEIATQAFSGNTYTVYTFDVNDASSDIKLKIENDDNPGHLIIDSLSVTEIASADTDPPVATWDPLNTATNVAINTDITITFDEAIRNIGDSEITDANVASLLVLKETDAGGADVAFTATIDVDKKVITINPDADLKNDQLYYVAIAPVEDANDNATSGENITFTTISATAGTITLTYPVGSEKFYAGDEINITWSSANVTTVDVMVYVPDEAVWDTIIPNTPSDGAELFTIPADAPYSDQYKLAVVDISDPTVADTSAVFTVISTPTINNIQSDHTGGLSNYDGDIVKTSGIITFSGTGEYVIQDGTGSWNGIYVYDSNFDLTSVEGDNVTIEAEVGNYNGVTQLKNVVDLIVNSSGNALPAITTITTVGLTEEYEGVYIKVIDAQVTNESAGTGKFEINDGSGALIVDDNLYYDAETGITNGRDLTITGIGHYNNEFQLLPRYASDIVSATDTVGSTVYAVDQGTFVISDIPYGTDLATFESNIAACDSATFDVFDTDGTTPATVLDETKKLIVTAADGITERTYTIDIIAASTDATVTSTVYTVDDVLETIVDIPITATLAEFEGNLTPAAGATFETYEADGTTVATDLATGYKVIVTAEDGTTKKTYTITINTIVMDDDSNVGEPTTQVAAATIAVVDGDEDTEAFEVFSFDINDLGTADGEPTHVSQIVLFYGSNMTIDFETEIDSGYFEVDGTPVDLDGEPVFGADSAAFPILDGEISVPDGGSVNVVLKLILNTTVADGKVIQFMTDADQHGFEARTSGSGFASTFAADVVGNNITIDVVATELNFSTQPTNVYVGDAITPAVVVEALDANGNIDTDYVTDISITAAGATLTGTPVTETPVAGVATFNALSFSDEGTGVTLTAASGTLTNGVSSTFDVTAEPQSDLFISEVIEPDGGNNKAIEIYNPTNSDVDLSTYSIKYSNNGGGWGTVSGAADTRAVLPLTGTLASKDVYVIINAEADAGNILHTEADLELTADYSTPNACDGCNVTSFNGNDAIGLFKDDALIDAFGDPLSDADIDVAGTAGAGKNHTILRKTSTTIGNTDWVASSGTNADDSEWIIEVANYFDDIGSHATEASSEAEILTFTFGNDIDLEPATITTATGDVAITVINGTDASALTPTITVSDGAEISPVSGLEQNFTSPVVYTVTAEDESTKDWTVTVTVSATASTEADITKITVAGADSTKINSVDTTIVIYAPYGFNVTAVQPDFVISAGATITDTTSAHDFTSPVTYIVTAQDATTTKNWEVSVEVQEAAELTIYAIQYTTGSGASEHDGELVSTSGIVTFTNADGFFIQDGTGAWNGIYVRNNTETRALGDNVEVIGEVAEYYDLTRIENVVELTVTSTDNTLPAATAITTLQAQDEDYEGVLISIDDAECTDPDMGYGMVEIDDGSGALLVDDDLFAFVADSLAGYDITGIGSYSYSERKILARSADDIVMVSPVIGTPTLDPVTPNSSDNVTITVTITDNDNTSGELTNQLFHGSAAGSEDTEVTFAQVGTTDEFEGTIPASSSTVYYKITASDGTFDSEVTGSYSISTGINNPDGIVSMNVYPNPSNGNFTLEMNASKAGAFNVEIINIQGQVVFTKEINQDGFYQETIDISNNASGIYYIRINDGKNLKVSKIIIQ